MTTKKIEIIVCVPEPGDKLPFTVTEIAGRAVQYASSGTLIWGSSVAPAWTEYLLGIESFVPVDEHPNTVGEVKK